MTKIEVYAFLLNFIDIEGQENFPSPISLEYSWIFIGDQFFN